MKAIIYNSGLGKRMGDLTKNNPKSLVKLANNETIFGRQLRLLSECGINDIIVTTGPFKEQIMSYQEKFPNIHFTFVENEIYDKTNYIYSMYKAREYLNDDIISLHGDLVFNKGLLQKVLNEEKKNLIMINRKKKLPEKDFKGRIKNGMLQEVSINIFDEDCFALQALYKLDKETINSWVLKVIEYIEKGIDNVYAENAFNEILPNLSVCEFSYENDYIDEIDNIDDLERVSNDIKYFDYREQIIFKGIENISLILKENNPKKVFVVCDSWQKNNFDFNSVLSGYDYILFDEFKPNPTIEDINKGVQSFVNNACDFLISLGGGSAIDTAKVIKLRVASQELDYKDIYSPIKHLAIPTTAGTGAESTRYAVCYENGVKVSVTNENNLPNYVILESTFLKTLPEYQKKSTLMDALCQGIESYWSINSNDESKEYSKESISIVLSNMNAYLDNDETTFDKMLMASNLAGKAINITQTTACHAMSYKLTSMFKIAHGDAVSRTIVSLWNFMLNNLDKCSDSRGKEYLEKTFNELADIFGCRDILDTIYKLSEIIKKMNFSKIKYNSDELGTLVNSVNIERLGNTPINLSKEDLQKIYIESLE